MDKTKNILSVVGIIAIIILISLVIVGVRVAWSIIIWVIGALIVLFVIGLIIYLVGKARGKTRDRIDD